MNEAKQMHDDLLNTFLPVVPRKTYQDIRRLSTLVWAIVGLCLTHTVRLGAWTEVLESRAQYAASRVRRFSRWLHHPSIHRSGISHFFRLLSAIGLEIPHCTSPWIQRLSLPSC